MSGELAKPQIVAIRGLELGYGADRVLADVDWTVREGEYWFLLGQNGSGKTTLLRGLLGLLAPRAGTLALDPERAGRDHTGFVPQHFEMNRTLRTTVREFVDLGLVGTRTRGSERREQLVWALEHTGLAGLETCSLSALSGGQRRRALVARALVRRPSLLILDEPTEGLDITTEEGFLETIDHLNADHRTTVILVTHKLEIAMRHATHVALASGGTLRVGPRGETLSQSSVREVFGDAGARICAAVSQ